MAKTHPKEDQNTPKIRPKDEKRHQMNANFATFEKRTTQITQIIKKIS